MTENLIAAGRIRGAWGVRGEVRIEPFNEPRESLLLSLRDWWLQPAIAGAPDAPRPVRVAHARVHGATAIVARLAGIDDREAAQALAGRTVLLARAQFPEPDAGEIYWADLIGCRVLDPDRAELGVIAAIEDHPAHPLLRVEARRADESGGGDGRGGPAGSTAREGVGGPDHPRRPAGTTVHLIPLVPELLLSVDPAARIVVADWRADY